MTTTIAGKTPEEIKKGLECCSILRTNCSLCPYEATVNGDCLRGLIPDALAYIEQLERERDAAQNDLYLVGSEQGTFCDICKYKGDACDKQKATEMYCWEWRGVLKEV